MPENPVTSKMRRPEGFAAFCALVEYDQREVVDTLVLRFRTPREEADRIVEAAYQKHAAEEAEAAAHMHLQGE